MAEQVTHGAAGPPVSTESQILETGAAAVQDFAPLKNICAHLNALHVYANDTARCVEANHYCAHVSDDVRQCLIYDSDDKNARLIGIEYMVTPKIFQTLEQEEKKLWHTHVFEVKSGMLVMPVSSAVPNVLWEAAEKKEMEQVVKLYGKVYHLWQTDRGDKVPLGGPQLMTSFVDENSVAKGNGRQAWDERDRKFDINSKKKAEQRMDIREPELDSGKCIVEVMKRTAADRPHSDRPGMEALKGFKAGKPKLIER